MQTIGEVIEAALLFLGGSTALIAAALALSRKLRRPAAVAAGATLGLGWAAVSYGLGARAFDEAQVIDLLAGATLGERHQMYRVSLAEALPVQKMALWGGLPVLVLGLALLALAARRTAPVEVTP